MQQWEYCQLDFSSYGNTRRSTLMFFQPTGTDTTAIDINEYHNKLAELGRQGWELISVTYISVSHHTQLAWHFKRPLP